MDLRSSKLVKIILCCVTGIIIFTGCTSTDTPTDPVVVEPSEPVEERSQIEILAEEYDHLAWYLDDSTTKTVDGVAYDLTSLKQQYGDLYRFVEPLSNEEVEYRFQYLAEYFASNDEKGIEESLPGGIKGDSSEIFSMYLSTTRSQMESLYRNELGPEFSKFSKYYMYLEKTKNYYENLPSPMNRPKDIIDIMDSLSFEDKNWFVRNYLSKFEILVNIYKEKDIELDFDIKLSEETK